MKYSEQIKLLAQDLQVGDTKRLVCIFCHAEHEKSLAITRTEEGIKYICPRIKCNKKGFLPDVDHKGYTPPKEFFPRFYTQPLVKLPEPIRHWLEKKYEIPSKVQMEQEWKYDPDWNRIYLPVKNNRGDQTGAILKVLPERFVHGGSHSALERKALRKADTYKFSENMTFHYPEHVFPNSTIVLVEDIISAVKVNMICPSVALLGTSMSANSLKELTALTKRVIWMLDPDATAKAAAYARRLRLFFPEQNVVLFLDKDPKDTPLQKLKEVLSDEILK